MRGGCNGEEGKAIRLTDDQIASIKTRVAAGEKKSKIASDMKISRESIYKYLKA
jgi:DNA-binding phage protein